MDSKSCGFINFDENEFKHINVFVFFWAIAGIGVGTEQ